MSARTRLNWYRRRLTLMQSEEVISHIWRASGARADELTWNVARPLWGRRWEPSSRRIFEADTAFREPLGFLNLDRASLLRLESSEIAEGVIDEAERLLGGQVTLLGYPPFSVTPDWDGATDPLSGGRWPDKHGRLIDFRHQQAGDPKLIWELHRLQRLPVLVLAWHLSGDERFAQEALRQALAWLERHPPGRGIAWANTFEPGLRALSLAVAFDGLRGWAGLDERSTRMILRGLWQHGRWITAGLSRFSSANNHLMGELVGLLAVGLLIPELSKSGSWASFATAEIGEQAELQILGDGTGAEQSFGYWVFVVDLLLVADALLEFRGLRAPTPILEALDRAGDGLATLIDGNDPDPTFGDADDGRALVLDGSHSRTGRGASAGIAASRGHRGARRVADEQDGSAVILFGAEGIRRFRTTRPAEPAASGVLEEGGMVVLRGNGIRALFDVGPLGYLSIAAHGHADALSITLSDGDAELIVDSGTGSYLDAGRRRWFRGTQAHATVCVDGRDQSEQGGAFLWLLHGNARLLEWDAGRRVAVAEHDGYLHLPDPVSHRRAVAVCGQRSLVVVDRLEGRVRHNAAQNWPLHPGFTARILPDGVVEATSANGSRLQLAFGASHPSTVSLDHEGAWSRRLEQWESAPRCVQAASWDGVLYLAAVIVAGAPSDNVAPAVRIDVCGDRVVAHVSIGGSEHAIPVNLNGAPRSGRP